MKGVDSMISQEKIVMLELVQVNGISKMILEKCVNVYLEDRLNSMSCYLAN